MYCGYSLEHLDEAVLTSTHNLCFEQKHEKYQNFLCEKLPFFSCKIFSVFEYACFHNVTKAVLTSTHNLCFEQKWEKLSEFLFENFHFCW